MSKSRDLGEFPAAALDIDAAGNVSVTGDVSLADNDKLILGTGSDLQIYHDGTNSIIADVGAGDLNISGGNDIRLQTPTGENGLILNQDGAIKLYYDGVAKLETTATGIDVTGTVTADGLTVDGELLVDSTTQAFLKLDRGSAASHYALTRYYTAGTEEWRTGTHNDNSSDFHIGSPTTKNVSITQGGDISFYEDTGTTPKFFWDASAENLGIGTSSPASKLSVGGDGVTTIKPTLSISDTTNGGSINLRGQSPVLAFDTTGTGIPKILMDSKGLEFKDGDLDNEGSVAVKIDSSGNVGIGTSSVTAAIQVAKGTTVNGGPAPGYASGSACFGNDTSGSAYGLVMGAAGSGAGYISAQRTDGTAQTYPLHLQPNGGNCGIGTTSPSSALHVNSSNDGPIFDSGGTGNTNHALLVRDSGNNQLFRVNNSGDVLVGKTGLNTNTVGLQLENDGYLSACRDGGNVLLVNRKSSDGALATFQKDGTTVGSIGSLNGDPWMARANGCGVRYITAAWLPTNNVGGDNDNAIDLGLPSVRFDDIYATNGTIQTSDRNEKQDILAITTAEHNVATACKGLLRSFRWKDAATENGDDARIHFGIIAQDLQDAFTAEGLDAGRYAMFISTTWWETQTEVAAVDAVEGVEFVQAVEASEALYSEDGELISEAVEAVEGVEGVEAVEAKDAYTRTDTFDTLAEAPEGATERTRLGVRYSELLAFIIAAI